MSIRHKYALNGVCTFENVREHMEANNFPEIPIGTIGGIDGWVFTMRQGIINDETYYKPLIYTREDATITRRYYSSILKNDGTLVFPRMGFLTLETYYGIGGHPIPVDEWLDEEDGYLTNGGIMIGYGLQIEGILSPNNIWTFNFHDPLLDCQRKCNMITFHEDSEDFGEPEYFYCHKQLLTFHSTYFDSDSNENQMIELADENLTHFNHFLQFSHGVSGFGATNSPRGLALTIRLLKRDQLEELSGETMKKCVCEWKTTRQCGDPFDVGCCFGYCDYGPWIQNRLKNFGRTIYSGIFEKTIASEFGMPTVFRDTKLKCWKIIVEKTVEPMFGADCPYFMELLYTEQQENDYAANMIVIHE
uniref:Peptidase A1 domain-containing protein n=1 Tax=Caenorhabditis tropicalis TaxID=1561998 RepID=A0A1I7UKT4_9PELO